MNITKGKLIGTSRAGARVTMGEYWTADQFMVCISCREKLLTMEKATFLDWVQQNKMLVQDIGGCTPQGAAFDPLDVGMDVE